MMDCVYLREETKEKTPDDRIIHHCLIHGSCTKSGKSHPVASCTDCRKSLTLNQNLSGFLDHLTMLDRTGKSNSSLRNLLAGRPSFLVCGGPSAKDLPLENLTRRGIWSLAVNNMAGMIPVSSFICSDPPSKFHNGIWLDPNVMKFVPTPKMRGCRGRLREKVGAEFRQLRLGGKDVSVEDCPNIWGFERRSWLLPDATFFTETSAAWGNHQSGVNRTGLSKTVCTMLLGLRILYYLGSRRIYLVGVDFNMKSGVGLKDNYAFGEKRDASAVASNNDQYRIVNGWLQTLQTDGVFQKFGLEIFNCNPASGLRAFAHVPFRLAIQDTIKDYPSEPFDLEAWYEK